MLLEQTGDFVLASVVEQIFITFIQHGQLRDLFALFTAQEIYELYE